MRYEDFKAVWAELLRESQLRPFGFPSETLDLVMMDRRYESRVEPFGGQDAEPFLVTAALSWRWDALQSARTATSEDDAVRDLLGTDSRARTDKPVMRVDISLHATLPWGKPITLPSPPLWAAWVREVLGRLEDIEPLLPEKKVRQGKKGRLEALAWRTEPQLEVVCGDDGALQLSAVSLAAGQMLTLPRQWNSDRQDTQPDKQLGALFARLKLSLKAWSEAMDHLRPAPPRAARK